MDDIDAIAVLDRTDQAMNRLDDACTGMIRVLREEAAWWAAGCPPREPKRTDA